MTCPIFRIGLKSAQSLKSTMINSSIIFKKWLLPSLITITFFLSGVSYSEANYKSSIKVFILAGQSNMTGNGVVSHKDKYHNHGKGNLEWCMAYSDSAAKMKHLKDGNGEWVTRDDVYIYYKTKDTVRKGGLTIGYTNYGGDSHFGPELQIGHILGDHFKETVLLIKTAWGGKSLMTDFRPPSSSGKTGIYYFKMIEEVKDALKLLQGKPYKLSGFIWQQGWNDMVDIEATKQYDKNLRNLIKDIRKEFKSPKLPVIIGELGNSNNMSFRNVQKKGVSELEHALFVKNSHFMPDPDLSPSPGHTHHWCSNAESYFLLGDALGKGMLQLIDSMKYERMNQ